MYTARISYGCGHGEGAEDAVEEDPVGGHGCREGLDSLAEDIMDGHSGPDRGDGRRVG